MPLSTGACGLEVIPCAPRIILLSLKVFVSCIFCVGTRERALSTRNKTISGLWKHRRLCNRVQGQLGCNARDLKTRTLWCCADQAWYLKQDLAVHMGL